MSVDVFFSYAHEDEKLCKRLETHLTLLKRQGIISTWNDRNISAGREWKREVDAHLNTAQIILLLVSPDFAASDYCYSVEMKRAMERHERGEAHVIPIIIRPVADWQEAPFGKLKALPTNGKPVTDRYWHTQDEAFSHVVQEISQAIGDVAAEKNGVSTTSRGSNAASSDPGSGAPSHSQVISDPSLTLMDRRMMEPTPSQAESKQVDMVVSPPPGPSDPAQVGQDKHALSAPQWKKKRQLSVLITCSILLLVLVGLSLHYSFPILGLGQHLVTKSSTPFPPTPADSLGAFPPPEATPVFQNSLHDGGSGKFDTYSNSSGACLFTQGAFYVSSSYYDFPCDGSFTLPQNLAIQVTMTFIRGPGGGIAIGQAIGSPNSSTGPDDITAFLNPNGSYELVQGSTQIVTNTTPLIKRGSHATNVIAIVARSHRIDLYINGQYIDHAMANFASPQTVKLFVTTVENHSEVTTARSQSEVAFKDLTIWKL